MSETNTLQQELGNLTGQLREYAERSEKEIKRIGAELPETKAALDKINERLSQVEESQKKTTEAVDKVELKLARPGSASAEEAKGQFREWARTGRVGDREFKEVTIASERKVLTSSNDETGGYLQLPEYVREIIKGIIEFSPVRSVARVRSTNAYSVQIPKRTAQFSASWIAETGTRSETTGLTWGLEEIPTHEMYALVDVSQQNLEDSAFNLEMELAEEFSQRFAVAEGTAFVSGSGINRPEGLLTNADVTYTPSGSASDIAADGIINLYHAIKDGYARNATWMMSRATLGKVRILKDGAGQYLWQPGFGSNPPTILGAPYVEATDMPAATTNTFPILFGDFRQAYTIVDRVAISILRDPYTQATSGAVRFLARKRVGGQVVLAEAVRKLKCSTS